MTALKNISVQDLPPVAQDLVTEIGLDATLALIEHWGGGPLWIPEKMTQRNHIARLIGLENAERLSYRYPGDWLLVPRAARALRIIQEREMLEKIDSGHSAPQEIGGTPHRTRAASRSRPSSCRRRRRRSRSRSRSPGRRPPRSR